MPRRWVMMVLVGAVAWVAALAAWKLEADRRFYDGYDRDAPLRASVTEPTMVEATTRAFGQDLTKRYRRQRVEFDARPGERVPAVLTLPKKADGPLPAIVLLHGSHQRKEFVEQICTPFNEAGFAMVCFDQYTRGERKVSGGALAAALAFRQRCWKTVHETRRLIDYLLTRSDIDGKRIYLVGASYGAMTGVAVLAQEERIRAAVLVVGGGNLPLLLEGREAQRQVPRWLAPVAARLLMFWVGPAEPLRHAPRVVRTPVLMQNGLNDSVVIPESGRALFAALGGPKEIRWYPIDHPDREKNGGEVLHLLADALAWLQGQDATRRD